MKSLALAAAALLAACTSLGPMAATTAISPVPANRPGVEVQAGLVPGFMLSESAHAPRGTPLGAIAAAVEPGDVVGIAGLVVGARQVGPSGNTVVEPFAGIRRQVDDDVAVAAIAFGTRGRGTDRFASYEATRVGGELAGDVKVLANRWVELHAQGALDVTGLWATGRYCVDAIGVGTDCNGDGHDTLVDANVTGAYVAATSGLSVDVFRSRQSAIHLVRLGAMVTVGAMPRVRDGKQEHGDAYISGGATLTLGFGRAR